MDWTTFWDILKESLILTVAVVAMMALIEYISYRTEGVLKKKLHNSKVGGVIAAAILGVLPGCFGGYVTVSMYSKRVFSFGALLSMMIATTGDEAFVMLAMFPGTTLWIFAGLFVLAIIAGFIADKIGVQRTQNGGNVSFRNTDTCNDSKELKHRLLHTLGDSAKIFLWAFGVLCTVELLSNVVDLKSWINDSTMLMVPLAALVGLIPQSGPHLIFVTMFAEGIVPLPVLLASCLSQDGHAGLPLLAEDKRAFFRTKAVKFVMALAIGYIAMLLS